MPTQMEEKARLMKVPFLSDEPGKKKKNVTTPVMITFKEKKKKEASRKVKNKKVREGEHSTQSEVKNACDGRQAASVHGEPYQTESCDEETQHGHKNPNVGKSIVVVVFRPPR